MLLDALAAVIDDPMSKTRNGLLALLGSPTLDPANDYLFGARRNTPLSESLLRQARAHLDGERDKDHGRVSRLLRRIGGQEHELAVLHGLSSVDSNNAQARIAASLTCPMDSIAARLAELLGSEALGDRDDQTDLDLWYTLLALRPAEWHPRLRALLGSSDQTSVLLGLRLMPEFAEKGDAALVLQCLDGSAPGSTIEAAAMSAAIEIGKPDEAMVRRAATRIEGAARGGVAIEWVNVLLHDRSQLGRAALDAYLAPLETATSWNSLDSQALAIRLGQGAAAPGLWRAGARMMHRPSLSGENFIEAFLERDRSQAMDVLLERAFAPPHIFTNAQPDAIRLLASADGQLATQAFVQSWRSHAKRRPHLVETARVLDGDALEAMIESLNEEHGPGGPTPTYRSVCVVLRSKQDRARPLLLTRFNGASAAERAVLSPALSWVFGVADDMLTLMDAESDNEVRRELYRTWRHWKRVESAVARFRAERTLESMEYAIDVADPEPLCAWKDPLRILEDIREDDLLILRAERHFAARFNALNGSKLKRVIIRKQPDES